MPYQPAILGTARLGNFRLGYRPAALTAIRATRARILINGANARPHTMMDSVTVHDVINDAPNTAALTVHTTAPTVQQSIRISINSDTPRLLFDGTLQTVGASYIGKPIAGRSTVFPCTAIDDSERAKRRRPFGTWTNTSATTIAQYLVAVYMPGFTGNHIQAGLPNISINLDGSEGIDGAFTQICKLIGGYYYLEDLDLYLFTDASSIGLALPDDIDSTPGRFLDDPPIRMTTDESQLVTRYYGKGHAEQLLSDVLAGETILPVSNAAAWFGTVTPSGKVITGTQQLTYAGVIAGGAGAFVGPGALPSSAPTITPALGSGMTAGVYTYSYTDVTAAGESLESPVTSVTMETIAAPGAIDSATDAPPFGPGPAAGTTVRYSLTVSYDAARTGETTIGPETAFVSLGNWINVRWTPPYSPVLRYLNLYRSDNGGTKYLIQQTTILGTSGQSGYTDSYVNASDSGGGQPPGSNTFVLGQATIAGIAVGASPTTQRKVYRSVVNGSQRKLQQTIANNTATTGVQDSTADGSLGANVPTSDTSGLTQPSGQVNAGSTTLPMAGAGAFQSGGGWAIPPVGQFVRYTGVSGNTLTGIPASGPGSISVSIPYNAQVAAAPMLTGVAGVTVALLNGAPINVWVQRDDLAAQAAAATRDNDGGDGVYEAPPVVDERRGEASLNALCDALLELYAYPLVTVMYATRDVKTKSGLPVVFNLTTPAISQTLTIQDVTISEIDIVDRLTPKYLVTASSVRFTLESILQKMLATTL